MRDDLKQQAASRPWKVGFSHWGEAFVECFFPEIDRQEHWKQGGSTINGIPCVKLQSGLKFEDAKRIVEDHNATLEQTVAQAYSNAAETIEIVRDPVITDVETEK